MVNSGDAILGITPNGVAAGGRAVPVLSAGRTSPPVGFFVRP